MSAILTPVVARGRKGAAIRDKNHAVIAVADRDLAAAKIKQFIEKTLAGAPPLSEAQLAELRSLLQPHARVRESSDRTLAVAS